MRHGQSIELISDFDEFIVSFLESFVDFAPPGEWVSKVRRTRPGERSILLFHYFREFQASLKKGYHEVLTRASLSILVWELPVLHR